MRSARQRRRSRYEVVAVVIIRLGAISIACFGPDQAHAALLQAPFFPRFRTRRAISDTAPAMIDPAAMAAARPVACSCSLPGRTETDRPVHIGSARLFMNIAADGPPNA